MDRDSSESVLIELEKLFQQDCGSSFPYTGCRNILQIAGPGYEGLIPDLDMYFYTIASHAGGAKEILKWPRERILESKEALNKSFFERHRKYEELEQLITESTAPDLFADLLLHDRMRATLLRLFSLLLKEN